MAHNRGRASGSGSKPKILWVVAGVLGLVGVAVGAYLLFGGNGDSVASVPVNPNTGLDMKDAPVDGEQLATPIEPTVELLPSLTPTTIPVTEMPTVTLMPTEKPLPPEVDPNKNIGQELNDAMMLGEDTWAIPFSEKPCYAFNMGSEPNRPIGDAMQRLLLSMSSGGEANLSTFKHGIVEIQADQYGRLFKEPFTFTINNDTLKALKEQNMSLFMVYKPSSGIRENDGSLEYALFLNPIARGANWNPNSSFSSFKGSHANPNVSNLTLKTSDFQAIILIDNTKYRTLEEVIDAIVAADPNAVPLLDRNSSMMILNSGDFQ